MIDRLDKFPEPYDAVMVKDRRSKRILQYLFIDHEHGFRRIRSWVNKSIF